MRNPKFYVFLTIILWSFGSLLTRLISIDSQFISLTLLFFFTFLFFTIFYYFQNKKDFFIKLKQLKISYLFFGLFGYFFYYLGLVQSFHLFKSASETTILNYTFPIFTIIFTDLFFRVYTPKSKSIKIIEYFGIFIGFLAVIILATNGNIATLHLTNTPALLWGLVAGISYGLYSAYSSSVPSENQSIFLLNSIFSSLIFSVFIAIPQINILHKVTSKDYFITALLALVVNGLGYITWTKANRFAKEKNISISEIASFLFILPILNLLIITIVLKENFLFQPFFLITLICILLSSLLCQKPEFFVKLVNRNDITSVNQE